MSTFTVQDFGRLPAQLSYVWDVNLLDWVPMTQPGGSGGGGAVTIANGADVAEGNTADAAWSGSGSGTVVAVLKKVVGLLSGSLSVTGAVTANQGGTWTVQPGNTANTTAWKVDGSAVTQPVSLASTTITGSVAVTGPLTDTQLRASVVPVSLASTTVTGSVAVTGPLTDTQLRASAVPVSNASIDVALSTRLAESTFTTRINTQGQKTMAASTPVVIASDQGAIPITGSISATSAATAVNYNPQLTDAESGSLYQTLNGQLRVEDNTLVAVVECLQALIVEQRVMNTVLHATLNSRDDLDLLRRDALDGTRMGDTLTLN